MPLSEHEQRLFEQIERSLSEDPKFASAVRHSDPKFQARRRIIISIVLILAGLGLVVYGVADSSKLWLGVVGFVLMLGAAAYWMIAHRRSQSTELRSVGGTATRRTRRGMGLIDRLESRWRERREFDR
ncbi:membrane protein [Catellatospora sp. TT07R-123]|uniref:DUF3040 domain-containing protein n=1 Tax=Catellatospora sp. TT07R-123 TaxID=2733863 RepID=UPI001B19C215|nr:DUF3040 domain-containing protein [Catellatospora sp. TT07R-123]GHJ44971.1 membrane protein [Catellatospora sp. TT07R-123]